MSNLIIVAGATGNLGKRIIKDLVKRQGNVRALIRRGALPHHQECLQKLGVESVEVDFSNLLEITKACEGGSCVISALSGLEDVIVEVQTLLLQAAIKAHVPRFIPSDFSMDFTKIAREKNRNFDLRREFHKRLDEAPIQATSIFNGAFTEMLTGQMPIILFKLKRVLYWHDADQLMDFTSIEDTATFTARIALEPSTPRIVRIAGDQISARGLVNILNEVTAKKFKLCWAGNLTMLAAFIHVTRALYPQRGEVYPIWQGMQYLHNMFEGRGEEVLFDNARYLDMKWIRVRDVLKTHYERNRNRA